jgi:hypothetical protein
MKPFASTLDFQRRRLRAPRRQLPEKSRSGAIVPLNYQRSSNYRLKIIWGIAFGFSRELLIQGVPTREEPRYEPAQKQRRINLIRARVESPPPSIAL